MDVPATYMTWAPTLLLAIARCGGIFLVAPVFASSVLPARLRLAMSVVMALAAVGRLAGPIAPPAGAVELAGLLVAELAIGAVIGYAARLLLVGLEMGAMYVSQQMGLALGGVFDANKDESGEPVSRLFHILGVVVFLAIGGHRALIASLLGTFELLPPASLASGGAMLNVAVGLLMASFVLALKVAAPVLIALIVATVAASLLQKTMPQFNILTVGLPLRATAGLVMLAAALATLAPLLEAATDAMIRELPAAFQAAS